MLSGYNNMDHKIVHAIDKPLYINTQIPKQSTNSMEVPRTCIHGGGIHCCESNENWGKRTVVATKKLGSL